MQTIKTHFLRVFTSLFIGLQVLALSMVSISGLAWADDEVKFSPTVAVDDQTLDLLGQDLLVYMIWDAYHLGLYLPPGVSSAQLFEDVPKQVVIHYLVDIDQEDFGPAGDKILAQNISAEQMAALRPRLDQINAAYQAIEEGERYTLTYIPGQGTTLAKQGQDLITIPGADFAAAYFQIWFGQDPVDEDLRDNVLAGKK